MKRPQLTFDESWGLTRDQEIEALSHKVLDEIGAPGGEIMVDGHTRSMSIYGRLMAMCNKAPEQIEALTERLRGKKRKWY